MSRRLTRILRRVGLALGVIVVLLIGVLFGGHPSWLPGPLRSLFVSESQNQRTAQQVLGLLSTDYYRPVNTTDLVNSGLQAAVASLDDPYSHYYPPHLYRSFQNEELSPKVSGIGVQVNTVLVNNAVEIEEVVQNSPAAKAGLEHGDLILAVNGRSVADMSVEQAEKRVRGRAGTTVTLLVRDGKKLRTVNIVRANVSEPVVASKIVHEDGKTLGYLEFSQFSQGSANELAAHVKHVLAQGAQGLILDLRDNPGGLIKQAVAVASLFIPSGTIVTTRGRSLPTTVYTALGWAIAPKIPMVVIVDRGTASSAEIVTGALKDRGRALVIGTRTYGKGVFQEIEPITGGGALDFTVGEYFTPNGHKLGGGGVKEGKGIRPNIYVYDNPNAPGSKALKIAKKTVAGEIK